MFGSVTWTLLQNEIYKIGNSKIKFLIAVWHCLSNKDIMKDLKVLSIIDKIN